MIRRTVRTCRTTWCKENITCTIISEKNMESNEPAEFHFNGYNPFPCFTMRSTYKVISQWMEANGWTRETGGSVRYVTDKLDSVTGEIIGTDVAGYDYIPVKETRKPQIEPSFADLVRQRQMVDAVKLYRRATGCSLREAKDAYDTAVSNL